MVFGYILFCNTKNSVFLFFVQYIKYAKICVHIVSNIDESAVNMLREKCIRVY